MRILAVGNDPSQRGFTLLELLVVLTIIAIGTAGVTFAFRDSQATLLEREAERLSVVLETARVQSRSTGVALVWVPLPQGYAVLQASVLNNTQGLQVDSSLINPWLSNDLQAQIIRTDLQSTQGAQNTASLLLGPEPMIAPSNVLLSLGQRQLRIATDGLRPFTVQVVDAQAATP
jgi:general secretion pathway protein H